MQKAAEDVARAQRAAAAASHARLERDLQNELDLDVQRKASELKKAAEVEAQRAAEQQRAAEEQARLEALRRAEEHAKAQRAAEVAAAEERARLEAQQRAAEEARAKRVAELQKAAEEKARLEAQQRAAEEERARLEALKRTAEEQARQRAALEKKAEEDRVRLEALKRTAEEQQAELLKAEEERARLEAQMRTAEAEAQRAAELKVAEEERACLEAQKRTAEEEAQAQRAAELKAAEERACLEAQKRTAEEAQVQRAAELKAAEERARLEAQKRTAEEAQAQRAAELNAAEEEQARLEAQKRTAHLEEAQARQLIEERTAEEQARRAAELKASEEERAPLEAQKRTNAQEHQEKQAGEAFTQKPNETSAASAPTGKHQKFQDLTQENINIFFRQTPKVRTLSEQLEDAEKAAIVAKKAYEEAVLSTATSGSAADMQHLAALLAAVAEAESKCSALKSQQLGWGAPPSGLETVRDSIGNVIFMESVYAGERDGFSFGTYRGKEGYVSKAAATPDDGLADVRELGWCLPPSRDSEMPHLKSAAESPQPQNKPETCQAQPTPATAPQTPKPQESNVQQDHQQADEGTVMPQRAASMSLLRLTRNQQRFQKLPENLQNLILNDRDAAIQEIKKFGGVDNWLNARRHVQVSADELDRSLSSCTPMTKAQVETMYGAEAATVMKNKREAGLVVDDKNVPGGELFMIYQEKSEAESQKRKRIALELSDTPMAPAAEQAVAPVPRANPSAPPANPAIAPASANASSNQPAAGTTAGPPEPKPKEPRKSKKLEPTTPLERAEDLYKQALAKKENASSLATKLKNLDYAEKLKDEINGFATSFEMLACSSYRPSGSMSQTCFQWLHVLCPRNLYLVVHKLTVDGVNEDLSSFSNCAVVRPILEGWRLCGACQGVSEIEQGVRASANVCYGNGERHRCTQSKGKSEGCAKSESQSCCLVRNFHDCIHRLRSPQTGKHVDWVSFTTSE